MIPAPGPNFPGGYTYVFQGTVAEDGTGGTHVCTLTVTPGIGSEMLVIAGQVKVGNTATAQIVSVVVDDGANQLFELSPDALSLTSANAIISFPSTKTTSAGDPSMAIGSSVFVSGSMRLILRVTTAAVSVTQTFALVCRMKNPVKPTTTLADTVGTPTLTKNTDALFTS